MRVIYIGGPFRSVCANGRSNAWGVQSNVMRALALALEVWKRGAAALCPHSNTMFFQDADGVGDDVWLKGDIELLSRCDAILLTDNWRQSSGARAEVAWCEQRLMPVLYTLEDLDMFLGIPPEPAEV